MCRTSWKSGALTNRILQGPVQACSGTALPPLPSGFSMSLGSTQTPTEMSKPVPGRLVRRADNLAAFMFRLFRNSESFDLLDTCGSVQACTWIALSFANVIPSRSCSHRFSCTTKEHDKNFTQRSPGVPVFGTVIVWCPSSLGHPTRNSAPGAVFSKHSSVIGYEIKATFFLNDSLVQRYCFG